MCESRQARSWRGPLRPPDAPVGACSGAPARAPRAPVGTCSGSAPRFPLAAISPKPIGAFRGPRWCTRVAGTVRRTSPRETGDPQASGGAPKAPWLEPGRRISDAGSEREQGHEFQQENDHAETPLGAIRARDGRLLQEGPRPPALGLRRWPTGGVAPFRCVRAGGLPGRSMWAAPPGERHARERAALPGGGCGESATGDTMEEPAVRRGLDFARRRLLAVSAACRLDARTPDSEGAPTWTP